MDSRDELVPNRAASPEPNLAAIQNVWDLFESSGPLASMEELLRISHEDVEMRSYVSRGAGRPGEDMAEVIHGAEEIRAFVRQWVEAGVSVKARARSFDVEGERVVVRGSMRVVRPDGSFAETKLSWTYRFRDGLIDEIGWLPRAGD